MPRADPEAYKEYQREYMRKKRALKKEDKMAAKSKNNDFDVPEAVMGKPEATLDLKSKEVQALLKLAEKANKKDEDLGDDDKILKYMAKAAEYAPMAQEIIKNLFAGFNTAALNAQHAQPQQQQNTLRAPEGWEQLSGLQRLNYKYSRPEWFAAGEAYEAAKAAGGATYITPVNTSYVDPTYRQPPQEPRNLQDTRNQEISGHARETLASLKNKYPEPPIVSDSPPAEAVEEKKKPEFVKNRTEEKEEKSEAPDVGNPIFNAMTEDNNKYIELAFNWLESLSLEEFKGYVENIEKWKRKITFAKLLLPFQTKEMLKNTSVEEFVGIFKERVKEKYDWLKKEKKLDDLKKLFEELKGGL